MNNNEHPPLQRCSCCDFFEGDPLREAPRARTFYEGVCSECQAVVQDTLDDWVQLELPFEEPLGPPDLPVQPDPAPS